MKTISKIAAFMVALGAFSLSHQNISAKSAWEFNSQGKLIGANGNFQKSCRNTQIWGRKGRAIVAECASTWNRFLDCPYEDGWFWCQTYLFFDGSETENIRNCNGNLWHKPCLDTLPDREIKNLQDK